MEIDVVEAAKRLGITRQRVLQLIEDKCPECQGAGCERCRKTGSRLPARQVCCGPKARYKIRVEDLELVRERVAGRPKKEKMG